MTSEIGFGVVAHFAEGLINGVLAHRFEVVIATCEDKNDFIAFLIGEVLNFIHQFHSRRQLGMEYLRHIFAYALLC